MRKRHGIRTVDVATTETGMAAKGRGALVMVEILKMGSGGGSDHGAGVGPLTVGSAERESQGAVRH